MSRTKKQLRSLSYENCILFDREKGCLMCLKHRKENIQPEVNAFKIFSRSKTGELKSVFAPSYKDDLIYPSNQRIRVNPEESTFFAFESYTFAVRIAREGLKKWRMVSDCLVVLPVTLFEVVAKGDFWVPSDDIQSLDGYYPAFESKEIIVHDSEENRALFHNAVLASWFKKNSYGMSRIEKEAFSICVPQFYEFLK